MVETISKNNEETDSAIVSRTPEAGAGLIGVLRDDAEILDRIVDDAMRRRQLSAWLPGREDFAALEAMAEETGRPLQELLDEALRLLLLQHREHG